MALAETDLAGEEAGRRRGQRTDHRRVASHVEFSANSVGFASVIIACLAFLAIIHSGGGSVNGVNETVLPVLVAYTPFIDPINAHSTWYLLLIPLAVGISVVYKAVRVGDLRYYPRQVLAMTGQIVGVMVLLAVGAYVLIQHLLPVIFPAR